MSWQNIRGHCSLCFPLTIIPSDTEESQLMALSGGPRRLGLMCHRGRGLVVPGDAIDLARYVEKYKYHWKDNILCQ